MGQQSEAVFEDTRQYLAATYGRNEIALKKGEGCTVWDEDGKRYLDFTSGIGVNSLGFCDALWAQAVSAQAHTLQHTSNLFYTQPGAQLAKTLCEATGMRKVFFANSGAEANEGAIKTARKYAHDRYGEKRWKILTLKNSFHGRTMATLSATGQEGFHQNFAPFPEGFSYVPANELGALEAALDESVCAVLLELIQGEGGVVPLEPAYVKAAAALCRERDVLLMVDEVQTGIGRTGTLLACEQYGIVPDVATLAKGLGGGLPIGAVLFGEKTQEVLGAGDHGSTFGANPVVCAGANAVLDRLTPSFLSDVRKKGEKLRAGLLELPRVTGVTGLGLMLGVSLEASMEAKAVLRSAAERGLLCLTAKARLRLLPPLVVSEEEIEAALSILRGVLEEEKP